MSEATSRIECVDYFESYATVVSWSTVRMIMNMAIQRGWSTRQVYFSNVFVQATPEEEIYIELPAMFCDKNKNGSNDGVVLKLKITLWLGSISTLLVPPSPSRPHQTWFQTLDSWRWNALQSRHDTDYLHRQYTVLWIRPEEDWADNLWNWGTWLWNYPGRRRLDCIICISWCQHHSQSSNKIAVFD